ncbi:hypothetical protein K469DRAFT_708406 [Zopfia rhizophila CBS 207.26]|uniref:DUF3074 domain-containing protein n=1 Tax=Zopfia rhizophila CBS 207.26 TaxID=1314779 RepID=A0A6A6E3M9_9PEZI|nr:hypothetical protein K469DRAFT_708406 [Zopfia rhizophila CBS 207.26]
MNLRSTYLQLQPLGLDNVPSNKDLIGHQENEPRLEDFLRKVLGEVVKWEPRTWKQTGTKTLSKDGSYPDVKQYTKEIEKDTWFARSSEHRSEGRKKGTEVRFEEFDFVLRQNHSKHEGEYTPDIFNTNTVLTWDPLELNHIGKQLGWKNLTMKITHMYHKLPFPLRNRVFTVLLLSGIRFDHFDISASLPSNPNGDPSKAANTNLSSFFVIQLPVDFDTFPIDLRERTHHYYPSPRTYQGPTDTTESKAAYGKKLIKGMYASVERVTCIEQFKGDFDRIDWTMSTVSDAGGWLPQYFQKPAVPGMIAQDIRFVLDYVRDHRKDDGWPISAKPFAPQGKQGSNSKVEEREGEAAPVNSDEIRALLEALNLVPKS